MLKEVEKLNLKIKKILKEYSTSEFSLEKKMRIDTLNFEINELCKQVIHLLYLEIKNTQLDKQNIVAIKNYFSFSTSKQYELDIIKLDDNLYQFEINKKDSYSFVRIQCLEKDTIQILKNVEYVIK